MNTECRIGELNGPPFGNWGVETDTTRRKDGHQFQGWCTKHQVCDDDDPGDCTTYCKGTWFQWNSCTTNRAEFRAPNEDFYNYKNHTEQVSTTRKSNLHSNGTANIVVSCPSDDDGDYYADSGGCKELLATGFGITGNQMDLYELDHGLLDDFVGRLRYPKLSAKIRSRDCNIYNCSGGSDGTYRDKYPGSSTRAVSASAAIQITSAEFKDSFGNCCDPLSDPGRQQ